MKGLRSLHFTALIIEICKEDAVGTAGWLDLLDKAIKLCECLPDTNPDKAYKGTLLTEVGDKPS